VCVCVRERERERERESIYIGKSYAADKCVEENKKATHSQKSPIQSHLLYSTYKSFIVWYILKPTPSQKSSIQSPLLYYTYTRFRV